jgi:hypothetical protein
MRAKIGAKTFYAGYPTEFAGSSKNHKKNHRKTYINQPNRKKLSLVPQKWKGAENSYGGYPTEFSGSIQNFQKLSEQQISQVNEKISKTN